MNLEFKRNLGPLDRIFRVVLGLFLVAFAYSRIIDLQAWGLWIFYLLGLSQIVEGAAGY